MTGLAALHRHAERLVLIMAAILTGCDAPPTLTQDDVATVLTQAATLAASKMPFACVKPELSDAAHLVEEHAQADGWIHSDITKGVRYRYVPTPRLHRLPDAAIQAFAHTKGAKDCRHTLVFEYPKFLDVRPSRKTGLHALVGFYDPCPLCGAGFEIDFERNSRGWSVETPGLYQTWIS